MVAIAFSPCFVWKVASLAQPGSGSRLAFVPGPLGRQNSLTLAYVVPLVAYAGFRSLKTAGVCQNVRGLLLSSFAFCHAEPVALHSYRRAAIRFSLSS